jgi:hypothetical protein
MANEKLLEKVARLGLPMLVPETELNTNETLAEVVKSSDQRLWEGFPVLLARANEDYHFSLDKVERMLNRVESEQLRHLVLLSLAVYGSQNVTLPWARKYMRSLGPDERNQVKRWRNLLVHNKPVEWNDHRFSAERLGNTFHLYFEQSAQKSRRRKEKYEEYSLEQALSVLFSPKQKELFKKKLEGLPFSKTESEYYSRTVRKKVVALANTELHDLARKLLEM